MPSACPEKGESVGQDAGERLQVPSQAAPEEKLCHLLASGAYLVLEEELQGKSPKYLGLWQCRGKNAEDDDQSEVDQVAPLHSCPEIARGSDFTHVRYVVP